jgi:hypothetical protein
MSIVRQTRGAIRKLAFGDTNLPQEFTIGLNEPQTLTTVWLHGLSAPIDVTQRYTTACCAPLLIGIALDSDQVSTKAAGGRQDAGNRANLRLQFCEQTGEKRLLGEIRLILRECIAFGNSQLLLCEVKAATNFCLPATRLCAHYLLLAWSEWRRVDTAGIRMSFLEMRAAMITFIRPHPLALVSIRGEAGGNMFPMNLMGDLGHGYFAFALKDSRLAAHQVARAGQLTLSNVPLPLCSTAFAMAVNHTRQSIDWKQLPFEVRSSATLEIPVPVLAPRVRELEVERVFKLGSHNLFVARIISEERLSDAPQVNIIHGFYQFWRLRGDRAKLRASIAEDALNKRRA